MSGLLLVVGKLRQLHKNIGCGVVSWAFDLQVLRRSMHPVLFPFSQPKSSHQSSKLHPDPDCAVLCRCPMWRPFPSLFQNNWSCHRHSDAAARSHTLDSTCSSGILTPQPPALSWTVVVGSPSQDLCNPSHLELSQSYAGAIQAFRTRRLSVDLSCWWSFQEMLGCLKCHKQAMMKTMKMMKIHQSTVLWKHVHWAFSAVLLVLTVG